jgi:hypothetical protein
MRHPPLVLAALAAAPCAWGQLVTGDVQVVAYSTKSPKDEQLAFVLWRDLAGGTEVHFTSSGFFSNGNLRNSEDNLTWTAPAGGVTAGTVIAWDSSPATDPVNIGSISGSLTLTEQDDQIFAGSLAFPTGGDGSLPGAAYGGILLHGLNIETSSPGWDATASDDFTSSLPTALAGDLDNFTTPTGIGIRNGEYTGPRSGLDLSSFRAAIDDPANWTFSQDSNFSPSGFTFSVVIPEPSTIVPLAVFLGGALLGHRRRK